MCAHHLRSRRNSAIGRMAYNARLSARAFFAASGTKRRGAIYAVLVPPNTNRGPGFDLEFLEDVLDVFLHGARAAAKDLSDLAVAFAGGDPFDDFELAFGERPRFNRRSPGPISGRGFFDATAVPGGHG